MMSIVDALMPQTRTEWEQLWRETEEQLRARGLRVWARPSDDPGDLDPWPLAQPLLLFPFTWYEHIPLGLPVITIRGESIPFERATCSDDHRFGVLAFGVLAAPEEAP